MKKALLSVFLLLVFSSLSHSELNIELLGIIEGENNGDHFGLCVASLGDINGDGFEDFAVGAPYYPEWTDTGRVYIYFGSESCDLSVDLVLEAPENAKWFGWAISGFEDVTGDGYDEFLVGAWGHGVFLYFGGDPPDHVPDRVYWEPMYGYGSDLASGDVDKDSFSDFVVAGGGDDTAYVYLGSEEMDTIPDFVLCGFQVGMDGLAIGDVNGDGYDDIAAYGTKEVDASETLLYFGRDSLHSEPDLIFPHSGSTVEIGDVNGDNYGDIIASYHLHYGGEDIDTLYDVWLSKGRRAPTVGRFNSDRYGDIVCAWANDLGFDNSNHIYLGGAEVDTVLDWTRYGGTWWNLGYDIAAVDLNSDGVDEFLLGAPYYPDEPVRRGMVMVYTGDTVTTSVEDMPGTLPSDIFLLQNYPNPFNSSTSIRFSVGSRFPIRVSLKVYDLQGRLVRELFAKPAIPGTNRVVWDGTNDRGEGVSSGVYFISLRSGDERLTRKALLIR